MVSRLGRKFTGPSQELRKESNQMTLMSIYCQTHS